MDVAFGNRKLRLNVFNSLNSPTLNDCYRVDTIDEEVLKHAPHMLKDDPFELYFSSENEELFEVEEVQQFEEHMPSLETPPTLQLKPLPSHLKYAYLGENDSLPVIIAYDLSGSQEEALPKVDTKYKKAD
ncbi:hypothetical protein Tco_1193647 [Tanacetum coccineum]